MRLISVDIDNFRSIKKISNLNLDNPLTVFVGANEHGKSNLLRAIGTLREDRLDEDDARRDTDLKVHYPHIEFKVSFDSYDIDSIASFLVVEEGDEAKSIPTNCKYAKYLKQEDDETVKGYYSVTYDDYDTEVATAIHKFMVNKASKKIVYFDDFNNRLNSRIPETEIQDETNAIVGGLMKISGLDEVRLTLFKDTPKNRQLKNASSQKATEDIRLAWRQGKDDDVALTITVDSGQKTVSVDVQDRNSYVDFGERSRGFQWFLSFYLHYRAHHDGDLEKSGSLFVIDEPGLFLHPRGQKDLLAYLEKLGDNNQIIYSTHSPFMINRLKPNTVMVVQKAESEGTIVNSKSFSSNWKPLRTSLGMVLSDSFYFADKTLIVEGVEDQLYITALIKFLYEKSIIANIDVNLLSIIAAGGASELSAMTRIVLDEQRPTAVFMDSDRPNDFMKLSKNKALGADKLRQVKDFGDDKTFTIQDLLPKKIYEAAVNQYIGVLIADGRLKPSKVDAFTYSKIKGKADKQADAYVKDHYGEDEGLSKVGIAREFERILLESDYVQKEFARSEALVKWIVNNLGLSADA